MKITKEDALYLMWTKTAFSNGSCRPTMKKCRPNKKINKKKERTSAMKKSLRFLTLGLMAFALVLGGCSNSKEKEVSKAQKEYTEVQEEMVNHSDDPIEKTIDFAELDKINSEVIGWIYIPNTSIDYPIMQSEDDEKYLTTTLRNETNETGSIYIEKYNTKDFSDPVTIMYGHTVFADDKSYDAMFSDLQKYKEESFMQENPYIYVYTPDKTIKYQIFSCVTFDDRYILGNYQFKDPTDFQDYIDELRNTPGAIVNRDLDITQDSKVLTLSTCVGVGVEQRWLVNAVEVEEIAK